MLLLCLSVFFLSLKRATSATFCDATFILTMLISLICHRLFLVDVHVLFGVALSISCKYCYVLSFYLLAKRRMLVLSCCIFLDFFPVSLLSSSSPLLSSYFRSMYLHESHSFVNVYIFNFNIINLTYHFHYSPRSWLSVIIYLYFHRICSINRGLGDSTALNFPPVTQYFFLDFIQ